MYGLHVEVPMASLKSANITANVTVKSLLDQVAEKFEAAKEEQGLALA